MSSHRGISAVVGSVFLVSIVIASLSYISYSMDVMGNYSEQLLVEEKRQKNIQREEFQITSIKPTITNKLDGIIKNTGVIPLKITTLYIDEQGVSDPVQKIPVNMALAPGDTFSLISSGVDFDLDPAKGYNLKLVSDRGNIQTLSLNSPNSEKLYMNLIGVPNVVPTTFHTTLIYTVVNNMSNNNVLYNLTPAALDLEYIGAASASPVGTNPDPPSYPVLAPGQVATFQYTYAITGLEDEGVKFTASLLNGDSTNNVTSTVLVKDVKLALESGTSLESFGLVSQLSTKQNILYFHDETGLTPLGEYQMDGADPNGAGTTVSTKNSILNFSSASMTSSSMVESSYTNGIPWNVTLQYYSDLVVPTVTFPSMAFFHDCENCGNNNVIESTGNHGNIDNMKESSYSNMPPTHVSNGGPFNDGYFSFQGGGIEDDWDVNNNGERDYSEPQGYPDSTAVWLRIDALSTHSNDDYQAVVFFGDNDDDDVYEISVGNDHSSNDDGKIIFHYSTANDDNGSRVFCKSPDSYAGDGLWHFVVAVRPQEDHCQLWIDGDMVVSSTPSVPGASIDINNINVGWDGEQNSSEFYGDIALWMHWNNHQLTQQEILDLNSTSYGEFATKTSITIDETNVNGTVTETYGAVVDYMFDFHDPGRNAGPNDEWDYTGDDNMDGVYSLMNYTFYLPSDKTLAVGEHLVVRIDGTYTADSLPLNIRLDDNTMPIPTLLQTSPVTPNWPTFITFHQDDKVKYIVFNDGPYGAWLTYQGTRFVATSPDGTAAYGALPDNVNGTNIDERQDSIFIPDQGFAEIEFWQLASPPQGSPDPSDRIPGGDYNAAIFLSGFDEAGEAFLRTINLGLVHVTD